MKSFNLYCLSFVGLFFVLFTAGCGYSTQGFIYQEKSIMVIPVVNQINLTTEDRHYNRYKTYPVLLEKKLTNKLIGKFNQDGNLKVVNLSGQALELTCSITDYKKEVLRYTNDDDIQEQRMSLYVKMKLIDSEGKLKIEKEVVAETDYTLTGVNKQSEGAAQEALVDDAARRIVEAVVEAW